MSEYSRYSRWEGDANGNPKEYINRKSWCSYKKKMLLDPTAVVLFPNIDDKGKYLNNLFQVEEEETAVIINESERQLEAANTNLIEVNANLVSNHEILLSQKGNVCLCNY